MPPALSWVVVACTVAATCGVEVSTPLQKFVHGYQATPLLKLGQACMPGPTACGGFPCIDGVCAKCVSDAQCADKGSVFVCNTAAGDCVLKPISLFSLSSDELTAGVLAFVVTSLAAVAGIGGGGMLVPLYILVSGFPPTLAVSMSQATILGCSGLAMLINMREVAEDTGGPLINYSIIMILTPMTLSGTLLGHMIGRVLPDWLRLFLLVLLLAYMLKRTLRKARASAQKDGEANAGEAQSLLQKMATQEETPQFHNPRLEAFVKQRLQRFPQAKIQFCAAVWLVLVSASWVKHNYFSCGTAGYWFVIVFTVGSMVALTWAAGWWLRMKDGQHKSAGYRLREDEVHWDAATTLQYPLLSVTAGMGASLLGIGGGMVLSLLLFEMCHKMKNEANAAASSMATALVASKAAAEFYFYGQLPLDYAAFFFVAGCFGTCMGKGPIGSYIKRNNKSSWILFALAGVIGGSLVALAVAGAINVYSTYTSGGSMGFGSLCGE